MNKIVSTIVSLYITSFLYIEIPFVSLLPENILVRLGSFAVVFVLITVAAGGVVTTVPGRPLAAGALLIAALGLAIAVLYHILNLESVYPLPSVLQHLFASKTAFTVWLALPLPLLLF